MAKKSKRPQGWSVTTVTICAAIAVVGVAWAIAASAYATDRFYAEVAAADAAGEDRPETQMFSRPTGRRTAAAKFGLMVIWRFFANAVVELPHAPQVVAHVCTRQIWIPVGLLVVEGLVIGAGFSLKSVERRLAEPAAAKRKRSLPTIRVPKPLDD